MRILTGSTALFLIMGLPAAASAQDSGFYGELFGGLTVLEDIDVDSSLVDEITTDEGFNAGGALGLSLPLAIADLRVEGQVTYRRNGADELVSGGVGVDADGDVSALSGMGNVYVDLDFGLPFALWAGAGIGYARLDLDLSSLDVDTVDDDDNVLAYQAMAGVSYDFNPQTALTLGYTYFITEEGSFTDEAGDDFDADYKSHNVKLGLVYKF